MGWRDGAAMAAAMLLLIRKKKQMLMLLMIYLLLIWMAVSSLRIIMRVKTKWLEKKKGEPSG